MGRAPTIELVELTVEDVKDEKFLPVSMFAERTGYTYACIYSWIRAGKLQAGLWCKRMYVINDISLPFLRGE